MNLFDYQDIDKKAKKKKLLGANTKAESVRTRLLLKISKNKCESNNKHIIFLIVLKTYWMKSYFKQAVFELPEGNGNPCFASSCKQ